MITIGTVLTFSFLFVLIVGFDVYIYQVPPIEAIHYMFEDLELGKVFTIIFSMIGLAVAIWNDWRMKSSN